MTAPLDGLRVVDFSRVLAGPLCGRKLQDLGAEVIKVEPPGVDVSRFAASISPQGGSGYCAQQDAGKRNICIDLNKPEAKEIAFELCDKADILVENFRPGTLASFGLDYDTLARRNPGLIYVAISGYGQGGPLAQPHGMRANCASRSGFYQSFPEPFRGQSAIEPDRCTFTRRCVCRPAGHDCGTGRPESTPKHRARTIYRRCHGSDDYVD